MIVGVLYCVWGQNDDFLNRSIGSLPTGLPYHVQRLPETSTLLAKANLFNYSPFDTTLFLDVDTVVLGELALGFRKAEKFGLACCICECPYARRFPSLKHLGDIVEYNTGVLFFSREASPVFRMWSLLAESLDSSLPFVSGDGIKVMPENDQASFAAAVNATGFNPFILPLNWNLRPKWQTEIFGEVKIWHDYGEPSPALLAWNEDQRQNVIQFAKLTP
jgi:hypothetical protein